MLADRDWVFCRREGCRRKTRNATKLCSARCAEMAQMLRGASASLPDGSVPVECRQLLFDEVDDHRRVFCRRQASCIDYAERSGWQGFSCSLCPVEDEMSAEERNESWMRMLHAMDGLHDAEEVPT